VQFKLAIWRRRWKRRGLLVYQAAWLADKKDVRFTRESSMAKLFASEIAVSVANECVQIHGGIRVHQGLSGGEVLPRREAVHDR